MFAIILEWYIWYILGFWVIKSMPVYFEDDRCFFISNGNDENGKGCGHELMLPRSKVEKSIKKILPASGEVKGGTPK